MFCCSLETVIITPSNPETKNGKIVPSYGMTTNGSLLPMVSCLIHVLLDTFSFVIQSAQLIMGVRIIARLSCFGEAFKCTAVVPFIMAP